MKVSERKALKKKDLEKVAVSQRHKSEDAAYFTLIGGPHHGNRVRMYAPWDELRYEDGSVYELHAPLGAKGEWVYVHNSE